MKRLPRSTIAAALVLVTAGFGITGCTPARTRLPAPLSTSAAQTPAATVDDNRWVSTKFAYVTFRHPAGWQLLQPTFYSHGPVWTVGFLTDQNASPACEPPNPSQNCGARPFTALNAGRSVLVVGGRQSVERGLRWDTTIAGLKAQLTTLSAATCWPGATFAQTAAILSPVNDQVDVTFCSALPLATAQAVAARLFATATRTT